MEDKDSDILLDAVIILACIVFAGAILLIAMWGS